MMDSNLSEECIKHLIFREEPKEKKFPIYRSKFSEKVRESAKRVKDCHRTMGFPPDYPISGPTDFLKRGARVNLKQDVEKIKLVFPPKMNVPRREEWMKPLVKPAQNYVYSNALKVVQSGPKHGSRRVWDSSTSDYIHSCVIEPKFVFYKGFGKVPKYIKELKNQNLEKEKKVKESESNADEPYQLISEEKRDEVIKGLKKIWEAKKKEFQLLPVLTDTPPQIKRKVNMEKELNELECKIDLLERNKLIYVEGEFEKKCDCQKN